MISRMSSFDDGSAVADHFFGADAGLLLRFRIPKPGVLEYRDVVSSLGMDPNSTSSSCKFGLGGSLDEVNSGAGFGDGNLGLPIEWLSPSSSMSNIKSTVESFGLMLGLKGAFRAALNFLLDFSWLGDPCCIISSRLPTRARYEDGSLSSSLWLARKVISLTRRRRSSVISSARKG